MFTIEQFDRLHTLWDGRAKNVQDVCATCGICCHKTDKGYFPGEGAYLEHKTGYAGTNYALHDGRCTCNVLPAKAIICKIFPMTIKADIRGWELINGKMNDGYTTKCASLQYTTESVFQMMDFLNYLFSDAENRMYWFAAFNLDYESDNIRAAYADHGHRINKPTAENIAFHKAMFLEYPDDLNGLYHYKPAANNYKDELNTYFATPVITINGSV